MGSSLGCEVSAPGSGPNDEDLAAYAAYKDPNDSDIDDFENLQKEDEMKEPDDVDDFDFDDEDQDGGDAKGPTLEEEEPGKGWMAVKPFIGALVAPSDAPTNDSKMPEEDLEVDWVYGYRGYDSIDNLVSDSKGRIVYPIAGFLIAYDAKENTQQVFRDHNDDIVCLAQSPTNPDIVATGQVQTITMSGRSKKPFICVTNVATGEVTKLPARHKRAVRCVAFSKDGQYLASVGADGNNTVMVWDWASRRVVAEAKGDTNKISQIEWSSTDPQAFVTAGVKHLFFWTWNGGASLKKKRSRSAGVGIRTYFVVKYDKSGNVICGGKKGAIVKFNPSTGKAVKEYKGLHKGSVFAVCKLDDGFASGGKDGFLRVMDSGFKEKWSLKLSSRVRSIYNGKDNLLVGTYANDIFVVPKSGAASAPKPVVNGHDQGELWALKVTDDASFITAGEDNLVARWDMKTKKATTIGKLSTKKPPRRRRKYGVSTTSRLHPSQCARAVAVSPDGSQIVCGRNDGRIVVLDSKTLMPTKTVNLNKFSKRRVRNQKGNWIQTMSFSPNGQMLAVGTHASVICLCDVKAGYTCVKALKKHNAAITKLDWSKNSRQIRSTCLGYELLFFDIDLKDPKNSKQNTSATALKDIDWATNSCILTWGTQNVWDTDQDGSDVNSIDVFQNKLVATGDDYGNVNLFRYPVLDPMNERRRVGGHSAHVCNISFTPNGKYLISVGGGDKAIVQWKIKTGA